MTRIRSIALKAATTTVLVLCVFAGASAGTGSATLPGQNGKLLVTSTDWRQGSAEATWVGTTSPKGLSYEPIAPLPSALRTNARFAPDGAAVILGTWNPDDQSRGVESIRALTESSSMLWPEPYPLIEAPPVEEHEFDIRSDPLSISPDGRFLALTHWTEYCMQMWSETECAEVAPDPANGTYIRDLEDGTTTRLDFSGLFFPLEASFSPDGRRLVYVGSTRRDMLTRGLFVSDADGRNLRQIPVDGGPSHPTFSPDGRRIAYGSAISFRNGPAYGDIISIRLDGSGPRKIAGSSSGPVYSPDGRFIASTTYTEDGRFTGPAVQISHADGSGSVALWKPAGTNRTVLDWSRAAPFRFLRFKPRRSLAVVRVFGPGKVSLSGKLIARRSRTTKAGAVLRLPVTPKANVRLKKGARVKIRVRFAPTGGLPSTIEKTIRLGRR